MRPRMVMSPRAVWMLYRALPCPGRSPDWLKMKNPAAPAVEREGEEEPTSALVANQLECIAATLAAGTDPMTAGGSRFHVDRAAFPIAFKRAHNPLFGDL